MTRGTEGRDAAYLCCRDWTGPVSGLAKMAALLRWIFDAFI
jgi:hypothetical protein